MMIRSVRQTKPNVRLIRKAGMIDYSPTRFSKIGSSHNRIRARKGRLNMDVPVGLVRRLFIPVLVLMSLPGGFVAAQVTNASDSADLRASVTGAPVYLPISPSERLTWFANSMVGPKTLAAGVVGSAWATAWNSPKEYGPHWDGFSKRYGMRLTAVATGNAIEASLGTLWGEDPRYFPSTERRSLTRLRHAAVMVFMARRDNGHNAPAFARYAGIVGNNIISNTWRVPSETGVSDALTRSALELAGKFAANFFDEFWPDINRKLRKRR